jgi:hypothetical protein
VFWLFKAGALIFVGHARRSVRARLLGHVRGEQGSCTLRADQYQWETCGTPTARARTLLAEYATRSGKLPRCNDRMPGSFGICWATVRSASSSKTTGSRSSRSWLSPAFPQAQTVETESSGPGETGRVTRPAGRDLVVRSQPALADH